MDTAEVWPAQLCMCAAVSGRGGGCGVCTKPGGRGVWWVCLRGFEQPVGGKRHVCSGVEEAGWGAGFWSV